MDTGSGIETDRKSRLVAVDANEDFTDTWWQLDGRTQDQEAGTELPHGVNAPVDVKFHLNQG